MVLNFLMENKYIIAMLLSLIVASVYYMNTPLFQRVMRWRPFAALDRQEELKNPTPNDE